MHLTTKLFFTATLLAGNLFASFAGDVTLKITKKYINLPVSHQVDRKKMTFEVKGTPERNFVIRLADEKPDYWVFCDVSSWKGKTLRISYEGESAGLEKIYQEIIQDQEKRCQREQKESREKLVRSREYYTRWSHQIKTPIAAMELLLQEEPADVRALKRELLKTSQYVEMALGYVRLDSGTKDLVIAWYPLDEIVRKSIRKYAGQFIRRRIRLIYEGTDQIVLTDEKWLSFIIEQLLSNAVKYTLKGTVTITVSEEKKLTVTDTGMGIAPEDLPRIFEKGYTGYNGRMERKSTGIGLYLSQMAAKKLGHQITVESKLGEGSSFTIGLAEYPLRSE